MMGFERTQFTLFRTGACSQRPRPLGQSVCHSSKDLESFTTTLRRKSFTEKWKLMRRKEDTHAPESYYSGRGRRTCVLGAFPRGKTARLRPWGNPRTHVFYLYFSKCYIKRHRDYIILRRNAPVAPCDWTMEVLFLNFGVLACPATGPDRQVGCLRLKIGINWLVGETISMAIL